MKTADNNKLDPLTASASRPLNESMRHLSSSFFLILLLCVAAASPARAWQPRLSEASFISKTSGVAGQSLPYIVGPDETLIELAVRAGLGYRNLVTANPGVDPWLPEPGTSLTLPFAAVLPHCATTGITVNLAELRLYYLWQEDGRLRVRIYPIGVGREGWDTPPGRYRVASRAKDPSWTPPLSIRQENPALPEMIPPGPDNPLGGYWIGLSEHGLGIHGTQKPYGVGRRVSHGCMRMYAEDIEDLYQRVRVGTPVRIINEPIKLGLHDGKIFLEAHPAPTGVNPEPMAEVRRQKEALPPDLSLDPVLLRRALDERRGYPVPVSAAEEE